MFIENFGTSGGKALEIFSRMSSASQALKIPMDLVKDATASAAENFKMFGDNSQAAINILGRFGPVLKDAGMGPEAITELTRKYGGTISRLDMAQQAFVSQQAGGVGGLQGAFEIDKLKREGKIDEVQAMVEAFS